jgi:hypothetical protein
MDRQFFDDFCRQKDVVMLPKKDFVKEHKNIVKVLERGNPRELKKEAREQKAELKSELKKLR